MKLSAPSHVGDIADLLLEEMEAGRYQTTWRVSDLLQLARERVHPAISSTMLRRCLEFLCPTGWPRKRQLSPGRQYYFLMPLPKKLLAFMRESAPPQALGRIARLMERDSLELSSEWSPPTPTSHAGG